jgi:hypothetical protein
LGSSLETALEAGIKNLEERFARWIRLFETEHQAAVLNIEINRNDNGELASINLLVRPIGPNPKDSACGGSGQPLN